MLFCYKRYQTSNLMSRMVANLAVADLVYSIGNLMGDGGTHGDPACYIQGFLRGWGILCAMYMAAAITFILHIKVLRPTSNYFRKFDKDGKRLAAFGWVFSFIPAIGAVLTKGYGEVGGVCWVDDTPIYNLMWRYLQDYFWLVLTVIYSGSVWYAITKRLKNVSNESGSALEKERRAIVAKAIWYPLILIITRFPSLIVRALFTFGHTKFLWLSAIHLSVAASAGWMNSIVYGMTPVIIFRIKQDINSCCFSKFGIGSVNDTQMSEFGTYDEDRALDDDDEQGKTNNTVDETMPGSPSVTAHTMPGSPSAINGASPMTNGDLVNELDEEGI